MTELSVEDFYERVKDGVKAATPPTTIEDAVSQAGMSRNQYNGYRRLKHYPRANEAYLLARILGTTVEYLVAGRMPDSIPPRIAPVVRGLAALDDGEISAIGKIIASMAESRPERAVHVS